MVLSVPGRILALGMNLDDPYPEALRELVNADLEALIAQFEPVAPAPDHSGARDWSDLQQRMHYIVHLFRVFHSQQDLFDAPFTPRQVERFLAGRDPRGGPLSAEVLAEEAQDPLPRVLGRGLVVADAGDAEHRDAAGPC